MGIRKQLAKIAALTIMLTGCSDGSAKAQKPDDVSVTTTTASVDEAQATTPAEEKAATTTTVSKTQAATTTAQEKTATTTASRTQATTATTAQKKAATTTASKTQATTTQDNAVTTTTIDEIPGNMESNDASDRSVDDWVKNAERQAAYFDYRDILDADYVNETDLIKIAEFVEELGKMNSPSDSVLKYDERLAGQILERQEDMTQSVLEVLIKNPNKNISSDAIAYSNFLKAGYTFEQALSEATSPEELDKMADYCLESTLQTSSLGGFATELISRLAYNRNLMDKTYLKLAEAKKPLQLFGLTRNGIFIQRTTPAEALERIAARCVSGEFNDTESCYLASELIDNDNISKKALEILAGSNISEISDSATIALKFLKKAVPDESVQLSYRANNLVM